MDAPFKYGVYLYTKSMYDVEALLLKIKKFLGVQLVAYRYNLLCVVNQYPKDAVFGQHIHKHRFRIDDQPTVHYDDEDLVILRQLAENARASTMEISRKTGVPQQTVSYKIRVLEKKKVILGYRAEIAIQQLNFEHWAFEVYLSDQSQVEQLAQWANTDPHVTWFETSIGGMDVDFVTEAKDHEDLEAQLNELRKRFPNIRKLLHYPERYWKLTYLP
jgi:DNA-binding Lrp family transcriptional regulator